MVSNGWSKYQKLVLQELKDTKGQTLALASEVKSIRTTDIPALQVEIATLKVKAGIWGGLVGLIPAAITALIWSMK